MGCSVSGVADESHKVDAARESLNLRFGLHAAGDGEVSASVADWKSLAESGLAVDVVLAAEVLYDLSEAAALGERRAAARGRHREAAAAGGARGDRRAGGGGDAHGARGDGTGGAARAAAARGRRLVLEKVRAGDCSCGSTQATERLSCTQRV